MNIDFSQQVILENDRALLRPLSLENVEDLAAIGAEPGLLQYSPSLVHTPEHLRAYIWSALGDRTKGIAYPFSIYDKGAKQYAGSTRFGRISVQDGRAEIGWTWVGRAFQGTGLNQNCKLLLLTQAFEVWGCWRVELRTDARNMASRKAIEKIGAVQEGFFKGHTLMPDGHRRDTVVYAIMQEGWQEIKKRIFD